MYGVQEPKPMWEDCVDTVNNRLPFAVGRIYVNGVNFTKDGKTDLNDKIELLEDAFEQLLKDNDWMKEETKDKALEKVSFRAILNKIYNFLFLTAQRNVESNSFS